MHKHTHYKLDVNILASLCRSIRLLTVRRVDPMSFPCVARTRFWFIVPLPVAACEAVDREEEALRARFPLAVRHLSPVSACLDCTPLSTKVYRYGQAVEHILHEFLTTRTWHVARPTEQQAVYMTSYPNFDICRYLSIPVLPVYSFATDGTYTHFSLPLRFFHARCVSTLQTTHFHFYFCTLYSVGGKSKGHHLPIPQSAQSHFGKPAFNCVFSCVRVPSVFPRCRFF